MSEWKEYKLNDLVTKLGDGLHGTPKYDPNGDYYFINGSNLINGKISVNENTKKVTKEEFEKYKKELTNRTIFVSINGTLGNIALYNDEKVVLGKSACYFNIKEDVSKEFIKYIVTDHSFQHYIYEYATGSTIKNVPLKAIREYTFKLPDLPTQTAIAEILSSLDDKIELNNKINQELETLAQTLFKQWFIDFEFPNENGEPYKSSGGEMVESELGEIPKGWEVGTIESLTQKMNSGGTPSTRNADYYDGNIIWYSTKELKDNFIFDSERTITLSGLNNSSAKLFPTNTVVMAIYAAPTVGRLGILSQESAFNQAALGFVAKVEVGYEFMYLLLKYLRDDFNNLANGAAQQNLNVGLVKNFKILMPLIEPLAKFQSLMKPVFESIKNNQLENNSLTKTRDTLLPKLISGELEINEISN